MGAEAVFAALAEPRRREMLVLVRDAPMSVNDIAARFEVTQQAISQHLQVLKDAGLVDVQTAGTRRLYRARPEGLADVEAFLSQFWPNRLRRLKSAVESRHHRGR